MRQRIAIITARGGSKRIPGKNIREFCGKPIIAYSIKCALDSGLFEEVMVSTDSGEIAELARRYGATVPFMRSKKNAGDFAPTVEVILEVLQEYEKLGKSFHTAVCIYPTAPFVTAEKLMQAVEILENEGHIEVMPVVRFSYPPQRGYVKQGKQIAMQYPKYRTTRSQDLEPIYHDAGQFYCFDVEQFVACKGIFTDHIGPIVVNELEVQDIDNEADWKLAELKYQMMQNMRKITKKRSKSDGTV